MNVRDMSDEELGAEYSTANPERAEQIEKESLRRHFRDMNEIENDNRALVLSVLTDEPASVHEVIAATELDFGTARAMLDQLVLIRKAERHGQGWRLKK